MVTPLELLFRMRRTWLEHAGQALARGESLRSSVADELARFYDLLTEAIATGDPAWMEPFLQNWLEAQATYDVMGEEDVPPSLVPVLNALRQVTLEVAAEAGEPEEALRLAAAVEPVFSHALEFVAREEVRAGMRAISSRMTEVRDALERLDRSKSNFIAVAAHELKTPLTLIEGYSKMLLELLDENDQQGRLMVDGIARGTRRLKEIIDDMIDVSMIDNNMLSLHFQPVWLNRLLELARADIEDVVAERNLHLEIRPFEGWDEMTYADPERLLQAILNVLRNAVKFTPDGGRITVHGRKLPGFLELTIQDTGIGIAPEDQSRIFDTFSSLGNPALHSSGKTKFKGGGPGLGLPIAKGILEAHGGAIWVESPGRDEETCPGSTFHLMIPLRQAPPDDRVDRLLGPITTTSVTE